jgi:hypothetical protein
MCRHVEEAKRGGVKHEKRRGGNAVKAWRVEEVLWCGGDRLVSIVK